MNVLLCKTTVTPLPISLLFSLWFIVGFKFSNMNLGRNFSHFLRKTRPPDIIYGWPPECNVHVTWATLLSSLLLSTTPCLDKERHLLHSSTFFTAVFSIKGNKNQNPKFNIWAIMNVCIVKIVSVIRYINNVLIEKSSCNMRYFFPLSPNRIETESNKDQHWHDSEHC